MQTFPGGAVFSHTVATSVSAPAGDESYTERESIIFCADNDGDRLIAVHEHLSPIAETESEETPA